MEIFLPWRESGHPRKGRIWRLSWENTWRRRPSWEERGRTWWNYRRLGHRRRSSGSSICLRGSAVHTTGAAIHHGSRRGAIVAPHECFMSFELGLKFVLSKGPILDLRPFGLGLRDGASGETQFDFLPALVICDIGCRDTLHSKNLDLVSITTRECIFDSWKA